MTGSAETPMVGEFLELFAAILVFGYLLTAGGFYLRFNVFGGASDEAVRVQNRRPRPGQLRREILLSLLTILIFAVGSTILLAQYRSGRTAIYPVGAKPVWFGVLMFLTAIVAHDTWFYWTHRFMHWRPVFKYWHAPHHKSITPTAWAIFAFSPLEAATQFLGFALMITFVPMTWVTVIAFLVYDSFINTAGHCGFEVTPARLARSWLWWPFSTVTSHDRHHTNMRVNYGSFLNIWDRLCGTFEADEADPSAPVMRRSA